MNLEGTKSMAELGITRREKAFLWKYENQNFGETLIFLKLKLSKLDRQSVNLYSFRPLENEFNNIKSIEWENVDEIDRKSM